MSLQRFSGKVALITGGGTGIGKASAERIAHEGGRVVLLGRREKPLKRVADACGGIAVVGDTTEPKDLDRAIDHANREFGGVDILIASAGIEQFGSVETLELEDWRRVFAINLEGAMLAARAVIPVMRARRGGAIVLVSSVAGQVGAPAYAAYCSSKAGLAGLNRSLAFDYGPENIRCNAICPGWTATELALREIAEVAATKGVPPEQLQKDLTRAYPLRRMGRADEMAATIAFLASEDASFVTGTMLNVDGGGGIVDVGTLGFI